MSDLEKKFLLRSAGQITGPFSKKEVMSQIRRGVISIDDEVAEPFGIWWYLQDHQIFKEKVRSMNFQTRLINFVTSVSEKFSNSGAKTSSKTVTHTETVKDSTQKTSSTLSKTPNLKLDSHEKKLAKEVEVQAVSSVKTQASQRNKYMARQDREDIMRQRIRAWIKVSWQIVVVFALSIGAYIIYKEVLTPMKKKQATMNELQINGLKFYESGQYGQALFYFEKAYSQNILKDREKLLLASLFLKDGRWQKSDLILDELSDSSVTQTTDWFLLSGLVSFAKEDFSVAESHFNKGLKQKVNLALMNLAILKWKIGDHKQSLLYLEQLQRVPYERDVVFYLKALNLLAQNQNSSLMQYIEKDLLLGQESAFIKEYKQEMYLILAYSYMKEKKLKKFMQTVQNLLNEDPFFYKNYQYSSFMAREVLDWTYLFSYCKDIFEFDSKSSLLSALYGFCFLKTGQFQQGSKFIEQAKNRKPEDPFFLSMYAYLLMKKGEDIQLAQVLEAINYDSIKQPLPFIVKARFFETQQDWGRALKTWKSLLSFSAYHISGIAGVAIANYNLNDNITAAIYRDRGLDIYPHHTQLLFYRN